jgi:type VI secretion system protein ImpG
MNERFLELYHQELRHLRDMGREFARQHPRLFPHLDNPIERPDPHVERLLEGFSFLSARVQLKQEAAFPRFTEHLLSSVFPNWGKPTPSMAIVEFEPTAFTTTLKPSEALIPRGTRLWSHALKPMGDLRCGFVTAFDVQVHPIQIKNVELLSADLIQGAPKGTQSTVLITLETHQGINFSQIDLDTLDFFLAGDDATASKLYELMLGQALGVRIQHAEAGQPKVSGLCPADIIHAKGFAHEEALLPHDARIFSGHRLVQEYFSFPQKFRYISLKGQAFKQALAQAGQAATLSIAIHCAGEEQPQWASLVSKESLRLFTTPLVNLFPMRIDRVPVDAFKTEYHMVADRSCPIAYEIYALKTVEAFDKHYSMTNTFKPLFSGDGPAGWHEASELFSMRRERRLINPEKPESVFVSNYGFSEVFVSLVDCNNAPLSLQISQLGGEALVTNGAFPLLCRSEGHFHLTFDGALPLNAIRFLVPPTQPVPAVPTGETPWRLINLLSLNYMYLSNFKTPEQSVQAITSLLELFARFGNNQYVEHAHSVMEINTKDIVRRHPSPGPIAYAKGLSIHLSLDDECFSDTSPFLFGTVLHRFFAEFVQMNSFVELKLSSRKRGLIKAWSPTVGNQGAL